MDSLTEQLKKYKRSLRAYAKKLKDAGGEDKIILFNSESILFHLKINFHFKFFSIIIIIIIVFGNGQKVFSYGQAASIVSNAWELEPNWLLADG